ncbi:hypothetical protein C1N66_19995 [Bacillus cereus]|uniref:Uncharacterized protein n=1 Tax=Bacillus cereus TaxID=1396 RepID=A0AB73ULK8_BACCE|nr:hypothetical protein [Bacillus cereus]PGW74241.1 hypothetical protein COE11_19645 [Bacillus cereus]QHV05735.1 hypothetical protein C1N82_21880 [Bacillus cereus]QHV45306.1 hypothetical protein C1N66_19995 [Bacillus cereus]
MGIKDELNSLNTPEDVIEKVGDFLEKGHEIVDTLSEYSPYVKLANNLMNKRREHKCKQFLQGLAIKVFSREDITSDEFKKLNGLLEKDVNRILILDILEEATKTVSDISSKLLGIIAGQVLEGQREFNYNDWILINGLKNMNDWDMENFKKVYLYFDAYPGEEVANSACVYLNLPINVFAEREDLLDPQLKQDEEYKMLRSSLLRISSFQILSVGETRWIDDAASFIRSQVGCELYNLINLLDEV